MWWTARVCASGMSAQTRPTFMSNTSTDRSTPAASTMSQHTGQGELQTGWSSINVWGFKFNKSCSLLEHNNTSVFIRTVTKMVLGLLDGSPCRGRCWTAWMGSTVSCDTQTGPLPTVVGSPTGEHTVGFNRMGEPNFLSEWKFQLVRTAAFHHSLVTPAGQLGSCMSASWAACEGSSSNSCLYEPDLRPTVSALHAYLRSPKSIAHVAAMSVDKPSPLFHTLCITYVPLKVFPKLSVVP